MRMFSVRNYWVATLILCIFSFVNGCTSVRQLATQEPKISIQDLKINSLSWSGFTAQIALNVENPNSFALSATGLDYALRFADVEIIKGSKNEQISVPGLGSSVVTLPFEITYQSLLDAIPNAIQSQTAKYEFSGNLYTDLFKLPFQKSGGLDLHALRNKLIQIQ